MPRAALLSLLVFGLGCGQALKNQAPPIPVGAVEDLLVYDTPPTLVTPARPDYPEIAREMGAEGRVLLKVLVLESGKVGGIQILESPHQILTDKAIAAAGACVFSPAVSKGVPVKATVMMPFIFSLSTSYTRTSVNTEAEETTSGAVPPELPPEEEPPAANPTQK